MVVGEKEKVMLLQFCSDGVRELLVRSFTSTGREGIKLTNKLRVVAISGLSPLTRVDRAITAAARALPTGLLATGVITGHTGSNRAWTGRHSKAAYRKAVPESWAEGTRSVFPLWLHKGYIFGGSVCPCCQAQSASRSLHSHNIQYPQSLLWYFALKVEVDVTEAIWVYFNYSTSTDINQIPIYYLTLWCHFKRDGLVSESKISLGRPDKWKVDQRRKKKRKEEIGGKRSKKEKNHKVYHHFSVSP